jgi:histidine triad (HIT) family protein
MSETLFEKIINREIPADIIYEDVLSIVIKDIQPQAPTHLLIIPKKVIPKLSDSSIEDQEVLGHLMLVAGKVAEQLNLDNTFRIVINNGAKAGQSVFHLHLHLLSGRSLIGLQANKIYRPLNRVKILRNQYQVQSNYLVL